MPFRQRLKKTFSRNSTSGSNSETSSASGGTDRKKNSNVYQPGEKMPQKYRRPVEKAHKEKLEAFSFGNAWRRRSFQSVYSPMGSRMPSRKNSAEQPGARRSFASRRGNSTVRNGAEEVEKLSEGSGDDTNVANVGLSRQVTAERPKSRAIATKDFATEEKPQTSGTNTIPHDRPFTQEDLTLAMKRSHLAVPSAIPS